METGTIYDTPEGKKLYEAQRLSVQELFVKQRDRKRANSSTDYAQTDKDELAALMKRQRDEVEALSKRQSTAPVPTDNTVEAKSVAEKKGQEHADALVDAAKSTWETMAGAATAAADYGADTLEAVKKKGVWNSAKESGQDWGSWLSEKVSDLTDGVSGTGGWQKIVGMIGGGVLAWLVSSMFGGGGMLGTIVFAVLAIPFAMMGKDFAQSMFGGGTASPTDGRSRERVAEAGMATQQAVSNPAPGMANSTTSVGATYTADQPPTAGNRDWLGSLVKELNPNFQPQVTLASYAPPSVQSFPAMQREAAVANLGRPGA